jgi:hypothetical protein
MPDRKKTTREPTANSIAVSRLGDEMLYPAKQRIINKLNTITTYVISGTLPA